MIDRKASFIGSVIGGLAGLLVGILAMLAVINTPLFGEAAASAHSDGTASNSAEIHESMHQMMDAVHGEGASERMHEAMGEGAEKVMAQCASMLAMMSEMDDMEGGQGESMQNMMRGMMQ